jgi:hypothetical protein
VSASPRKIATWPMSPTRLDGDYCARHLAPMTGHQTQHGRIVRDGQTVWRLSKLETSGGCGKHRDAIALARKWPMDVPAEYRTHVVYLVDNLPEVFGIEQHDLVEHRDTHWHGLMVHDENRWLRRMLMQLFAEPGQLCMVEIAAIPPGFQRIEDTDAMLACGKAVMVGPIGRLGNLCISLGERAPGGHDSP